MRHKDTGWILPGPKVENWEQAGVAVMMDIRDELKQLNRLLACPNFIGIPATLHRIELNTRKRRKKSRKP
jgi:hypothetical protein